MVQSATRFKRIATEPQAKQEMRSVLCHSMVPGFNVQAERECHHCSGGFEQLLLTCIEGCGLQSIRFNVHAAACMHTVHTCFMRMPHVDI